MSGFKLFITMLIAYGTFISGILSLGGFILNPLFQHPKGTKRAVICLLISIVLFVILFLLIK